MSAADSVVLMRSAIAALLIGCSSASTPSSSPAPDTGVVTDGTPAPTLTWSACDTGLECATLSPEDGVQLPVMRKPATGDRIGVIVFNPGGPGNGVVRDFPRTVKAFATIFGADTAARFDFLAIDLRGTGRARPAFTCGDAATMDALFDADVGPTRPNPPELEAAADKLAASCRANTLRVDSVTAAKDLEVLRVALGEEKLGFLGISYGTWIGATYAALYPTHVRAVVLDSCLAPHADQRETIRDWARGVEAALTDFFAYCDTSGKCMLPAAMGKATAAEAFDALAEKIDAAPIVVGSRKATRMRMLLAARFLLGGAEHAKLDRALTGAAEGSGTDLMFFSDLSNGKDGGGYDGVFAVRMAIRVSDRPYPAGFDREQYLAFRAEIAKQYPRAGFAAAAYDLVAIKWGLPRSALENVATTAPPLLLIGGKHDPATIYDETTRLQSALGNGSFLITHEGYGHAQIYRSPCVAKLAASFFVNPIAPTTTICAM
jgi:pimeloyl-ACP methyl ester carboxylesterase